jgi:hypothetical protein
MRKLAVFLTGALSLPASACEGVPTLTFLQTDAASESSQDAADGGPQSTDADVDGGCPGSSPPPAPFVCCGPVACEGNCAGQCDACMTKCTTPGDVCCAKTNNVVCSPPGTICH